MKKGIKYLLIIFLLLFGITEINALKLNQNDYEKYNIRRSYVVGKYIFDLSKHNPTLKDLMLAAQSSPTGDVSIIEIKIATNIDGEETKEYKELLSSKSLTSFPDLNVDYIYMSEIMPNNPENEDKIVLEETGAGDEPGISDTTAPSCTWSTLTEDLSIGTTSVITLTCTDVSGIKTTTLTSSSFDVTGDYVIQGIQTEEVTDGYKYIITLQGSDKGSGKITLKADSVFDASDNGNEELSSESFLVAKVIRGIFYKNGSEKIEHNNKFYTDETTEIVLCTLTTEESCNVTLPKIIGKAQTPTVIGWSTTQNDSTAKYESNAKITLSDSITLYAQTQGTIKVNFEANSCVTNSKTETLTLANGADTAEVIVPSATLVENYTSLGVSQNSMAATMGTAFGEKLRLTNISSANDIIYYYNCELAGSGEPENDEEAPICQWSNDSTLKLEVGKTAVLSLVCTDTDRGLPGTIKTTTLTSGAFESSDKYSITDITATEETGGYRYDVTIKPLKYGILTLNLKANQVKDASDNGNAATVSDSYTIEQQIYGTFNLNGEKSFKFDGKTYTQSDINEINLNGKTSLTYGGQTYTKSQLDTICSEKNNKPFCAIELHLCTITNGTNCKATLPEIIHNDETRDVIGYSLEYDSTEPILYNSKQSVSISENLPTQAEVTKYIGANGDRILYAQVDNGGEGSEEEITYTARFLPNGGTGTEITRSCTVAEGQTSCNITLPDNAFTYSGWNFNGWSTDSSETSGQSEGTLVTLSNNQIYYALWKKTVNLTFKANSCVASDITKTTTLYNGGTSVYYNVPTATSIDGWTLLGASRNASSTSGITEVGSALTFNIGTASTSGVAYYNCKKEAKTYTVTFTDSHLAQRNLGTQTCNIAAVYNGNPQATSCTVTAMSLSTYDGWTFNGWATSSTATSGVASGSTLTLREDTIYYATWIKPSKTLTATFTDSHLGGGNLGTQSCT
ncbi:MAG: InlB B-repeat-containing protein, partial [Bacilli bacterium]|nr:InlB B-repeat-containing protein [Bacilli bacterium]